MTHHNQRRTGIVLAGLALTAAVALSGCSAPASEATNEPDRPLEPLNISVVPAADLTAPYIAQEQGFFEEVGLDVTIQILAGGSQLIPALESNSVQLGISNLLSNLQAAENGIKTKCIAGTAKGGATQSVIIAKKNDGLITTPQDLEGKTIAINTLGNVTELVMSNWLESEGVDSSTIEYVDIAFPDHPAALGTGQVDAAFTIEPFETGLVAQGFTVLEQNPTAAIADSPTVGCWTASAAWLEGHELEAEAFREAMSMVDEYLAENPEYVREIVVKYFNVPEQAAAAFELPTIDSTMSEADFVAWMEPAIELGFLDGAVDYEALNGGFRTE